MIISHKYKFIFVKTHKTAGSSLEMGLGALCGPDDIISHMETNLKSGIPRNYYNSKLGEYYDRYKMVRKVINRHSPRLGAYYYEHMPAWRIRELIGKDIWDEYYTFCFERNPWDKVVSYYLWKAHGQQRKLPPFKTYIETKTHRLPADAELYFEQEKPMVDRVYEFRQLRQALQDIQDKTGIPIEWPLPREKTGIKQDRKPYQNYYDDDSRDLIAELFRREIRLMNYVYK